MPPQSTPRSRKRAAAIPSRSRRSSEFIRQALLPGSNGDNGLVSTATHDRRLAFAHKFQQYTAPVVAKGLEDTAFYNDVLLVSTNEVGGDLRQRARGIDAFHQANEERLFRWPLQMTAGSTHDTKWGEDARARINVLSELSHDWRVQVKRWSAIADDARGEAGELTPRSERRMVVLSGSRRRLARRGR